MNNKTIQHYKKELLNKRAEFENIKASMNENSEAKQNMFGSGELSNYDNHPADLSSEVAELGVNNALMVHDEYFIDQVEHALEKIEKGTFGNCEICGKEIEKERLDAMPYASRCIECENENNIEITDNNYIRPVEEQVIDAPFGRKYLNQQEDDEYEGIDQLNDLMKYGSSDSPQDMGGYEDYEEFYTNEIDNQGIVDKMDKISNEQYKKQLPD